MTKLVVEAVVAERSVVVALVVVELPVMVRFPFMVDEALEMKPPVRVERLVTERVPPTERLVGEKFVAERFVVKKLVVVADVEVEVSAVKSRSVVEPERSRLESEVSPAVAVNVPVKLAAEEIV